MKADELLLYFQSGYYLLTALWPLLHIKSFFKVTGPKSEKWLVNTVSVLILVIAIALGTAAYFSNVSTPVRILSALTATALASIDIFYTFTGTIRNIYMLDAFIEFAVLFLWLWIYY